MSTAYGAIPLSPSSQRVRSYERFPSVDTLEMGENVADDENSDRMPLNVTNQHSANTNQQDLFQMVSRTCNDCCNTLRRTSDSFHAFIAGVQGILVNIINSISSFFEENFVSPKEFPARFCESIMVSFLLCFALRGTVRLIDNTVIKPWFNLIDASNYNSKCHDIDNSNYQTLSHHVPNLDEILSSSSICYQLSDDCAPSVSHDDIPVCEHSPLSVAFCNNTKLTEKSFELCYTQVFSQNNTINFYLPTKLRDTPDVYDASLNYLYRSINIGVLLLWLYLLLRKSPIRHG